MFALSYLIFSGSHCAPKFMYALIEEMKHTTAEQTLLATISIYHSTVAQLTKYKIHLVIPDLVRHRSGQHRSNKPPYRPTHAGDC